MVTRRVFLQGVGFLGAAPGWLVRAAQGSAGGARKKVLVAIFQRGASDGLNMVVPFGEKRYYELRPSIAIGKPGSGENAAIDLDGRFGLHPSLAPLVELYKSGRLAIVEAAGSPDPTRSHFDAQDFMESGTPGRKATRDGWMNRALAPGRTPEKASPLRVVAIGPLLPRAVRGANPAVAIDSLSDFRVRDERAAVAFESMYASAPDRGLRSTGRDTFQALRLVETVQSQPYTPADGAEYPRGRFGDSLRQIAQLIKAGVGVEVAFADIGGWDHHTNETLPLTNLLREFGQGLAALSRDLGDRMEDVAVVTMSEFGRTAHENGNRGTDHGHANVMFAMGGGVRGGKIYGEWPGLEREQLYEGRDLAITTDFRDVLAELVSRHLGNEKLGTVFPGYRGGKRPGLLAG